MIKEAPGFITSRINAMIGNEAFYMLQEGIASAADIDKALKLGLNHPMGPFELVDLVVVKDAGVVVVVEELDDVEPEADEPVVVDVAAEPVDDVVLEVVEADCTLPASSAVSTPPPTTAPMAVAAVSARTRWLARLRWAIVFSRSLFVMRPGFTDGLAKR